MINIRRMLHPGGILLHNDLRSEVEAYAKALGLPVLHARMVRLSAKRQLHDAIVLHQANPRN
jgi:hypothetical protein